jgi:hypothetical protein
MMKILLALMLCVGFAFPTTASERKNFSKFYPTSGENPFPWGSESPFPWQKIDGVWKTTTGPLYFAFEVIRISGSSNKYLRVVLLNQYNQNLAQGVGVVRETDQIIRARVVGTYIDAFALVRAYNIKTARRQCGIGECVMVVTLRDANPLSTGKDLHYVLTRP